MAFPEQPILDTCVRPNEGPPPSANYTKVRSDWGGMKIVSNEMAPNEGGWCSALWLTEFPPPMECYSTIKALPADSGAGSHEWWICVQNGNTATPSGYILRFWHSGVGGSGAFELDRHDSGTHTRLADENITLAVNDVVGFWNDSGTLRVYHNGNQVSGFAVVDSNYTSIAGKIGIGSLNSTLPRYTNFGGGASLPGSVQAVRASRSRRPN
jgi:hypothetical protein